MFLAILFTQISEILGFRYSNLLMVITFITFVTSGIFITKSYKMYFTDRIFIVVLNWALCAKTLTYIFDRKKAKENAKETAVWSKLEK